jgi:transcriptional regulator GlxA family with amidase domain
MLTVLASRCQLVAGAIAESSWRKLSEGLASLQAAIPEVASLPERLMIRSLIAAVISRVVSDKKVAAGVNLIDAFLTWTARDVSAPTWRSDIFSLIERCVQGLDTGSPRCQEAVVTDSRVRRALALLDTRFHRPTVTLRMCAAEMHVSVWHASRLLKEHTGVGFTEHLHRRRVRAAEGLLTDRRLSVKEIAVCVGYVSATQLGRQFKLQMNMTPVQYRRSLHTTLSAA